MTDEISTRVSRARSEPIDLTVVDTDPTVVQAHNTSSDRIHTVVPRAIHCSCEDHTYRGYICKHIIALLDDDSNASNGMYDALVDRKYGLQDDIDELRSEIDEYSSKVSEIESVIEKVDIGADSIGLEWGGDHESPVTEDDPLVSESSETGDSITSLTVSSLGGDQ